MKVNPASHVNGFTDQKLSGSTHCSALHAIAIRVVPVHSPRLVCVEEILVVVLVSLPLSPSEADNEDAAKEDKSERVVVDAESLPRALATWLVSRKGTKVESSIDTQDGLSMSCLRMEGDRSRVRRGDRLDQRRHELLQRLRPKSVDTQRIKYALHVHARYALGFLLAHLGCTHRDTRDAEG